MWKGVRGSGRVWEGVEGVRGSGRVWEGVGGCGRCEREWEGVRGSVRVWEGVGGCGRVGCNQPTNLTDRVSSTSSHPLGSMLNTRCVCLRSLLRCTSSGSITQGLSSKLPGSSDQREEKGGG